MMKNLKLPTKKHLKRKTFYRKRKKKMKVKMIMPATMVAATMVVMMMKINVMLEPTM
jgi:hypothetical protein